ncbi:MAG: PepSY domain-containing protein [Pseudomonadota bacterium]
MPVRIHILARKSHKWLGLLIGLQVVIWSLSGVYMTVVHIDTIHGDHLVRHQTPASIDISALRDPLGVAAANGADNVRLAWVRGQPAYLLKTPSRDIVVDAISARRVAPLSEAEIRAIATATYTGKEAIASAGLITEIPGEIRGRKPPLWRVEFDHWNEPTLYFSPATGELLSQRHELWRIFDFVWMLHIMDYDERENVNNWLLRIFTWGGVLMALSGIWLLFYSFHRKKKKAKPA